MRESKITGRIIPRIIACTFIIFASVACGWVRTQSSPSSTPPGSPTPTATPFQPIQTNIYLSQAVPAEWRDSVEKIMDARISANDAEGLLSLAPKEPQDNKKEYGTFTRVYAAVVPFPTVTDEISLETLKALWHGNAHVGEEFTQLLVGENSSAVFAELWGSSPSSLVLVMKPDELMTQAWQSTTTVAIIPFEEIIPKWKVLNVDGISPLDKPMSINSYALTFKFHLAGPTELDVEQAQLVERIIAELPATNRDETLMTVVVMSGTTALTRTVAAKMDLKGIDYPTQEIREWFLSADLRHVSNEVSVYSKCPPPDPQTTSLIFCSEEKYLPALESLGINVIELTGNHLNDYGPDVFAGTLEIYRELGWDYFGGGFNLEDAQKPLEIVTNGNKIAFTGCNYDGPGSDFATETSAGSAPCDPEVLYPLITRLKEEGFVVITTFQYSEYYGYMYDADKRNAFLDAAKAGADIIQGSQAHFPMGFEFSHNAFIHYGLGNFLFDQMDTPVVGTKREFIDRHIVYSGKYINTELLTAMLTDWSRPVPMTLEQRRQLLGDIFQASQMR